MHFSHVQAFHGCVQPSTVGFPWLFILMLSCVCRRGGGRSLMLPTRLHFVTAPWIRGSSSNAQIFIILTRDTRANILLTPLKPKLPHFLPSALFSLSPPLWQLASSSPGGSNPRHRLQDPHQQRQIPVPGLVALPLGTRTYTAACLLLYEILNITTPTHSIYPPLITLVSSAGCHLQEHHPAPLRL